MRAGNATCRSIGARRPIRELTRVEVEEDARRGQGQSYGDLEAIDVGFAPECVAGTSGDSLFRRSLTAATSWSSGLTSSVIDDCR